MGVSPHSETKGGKCTANTNNGQQVSVCRTYRTCGSGSVVIPKGVKISRLSGAESVMGQRGKLKVYTLFNRKPMKMFKNTR